MAVEQVKETELAEAIEGLQLSLAGKLPPGMLAVYEEAIQQLVNSGIAAGAVKVGMAAPGFSLPDQNGQTVSLESLLRQGPVVVAFYRGAWCPYCDLTLRAYEQILPDIARLGASLVAISPQTPDNSLTTAEKKHLTFSVLSDVTNIVARQYGLVCVVPEAARHAGISAANGDESWELPMPGTFVVAQDGQIRLAFVDADYTHRLEPAAILRAVKSIVSSV